VENVFGILTSRFGVFQKPIPLELEQVVLASCALHNYLRSKPLSRNIYSPPEYFDRENNESGVCIDAEWRQQPGSRIYTLGLSLITVFMMV